MPGAVGVGGVVREELAVHERAETVARPRLLRDERWILAGKATSANGSSGSAVELSTIGLAYTGSIAACLQETPGP